ncbi:MAG TPA: TPM domain-containing protein [Albidovulum sp.]|uniref:TPM domain-containing protein n=1 Tax=Albidovulum sp. TaxID=1872424 RepID=UPI002C7922CC|nr:TPM domain-containing protein [Albidovulum sp.]
MSRFTALLIGLLCLPVALNAEEYPAPSDPFVTDIADLLSQQAEIRIKSKLVALRDDTGIEATVVTIPTRADYKPPAPSLEAFATGLFNTWGIGNPDRNDGILLLVIPEDKETRLELGAGYNQGYDVLAQDIVSRWLVPAFRDGDYSDGIEAGMDAVVDRIARRHSARLEPEALPDRPGKMWDNLGAWIFGAVFALVAGFAIFGRKISDLAVGLKRCTNCGSRTLSRTRTTLVHAGPGVPGTTRIVTSCITCGNRDEREERIGAGRRGASSGRDGGFGGGRSSGGGASGRW